MDSETAAALVFREDGLALGITSAITATSTDGEQGLIWHPLIPIGHFEHPAYGGFDVTEASLRKMIANLGDNIPGPKGIPIDEDGIHALRAAGAFGWIKELKLEDNTLWGGIEWTPDGMAAVDQGRYAYISVSFRTGSDPPHPVYERDNLIASAALCTRPFFFDQPELKLAIGEYVQTPAAEGAPKQPGSVKTATLPTTTVGGTPMEQEARTKYETVHGKQSDDDWKKVIDALDGLEGDEAWGKFIAGIETNDDDDDDDVPEDELAKLRAELEAAKTQATKLETQVTEEQARVTKAEAEKTEMGARIGKLEEDGERAEVREEVTAAIVGNGERYATSAVDVLTDLRVSPSPETVAAFNKHLAENGGRLAIIPTGEAPNVSGRTATGELTDEQWFEQKPLAPNTQAQVRGFMKKHSIGPEEAYREHYLPTITSSAR